MTAPLVVEMDVAEPRIKRDRLVVSADGSTWDMRVSSLYLEPVTNTLMLQPLPRTDAWQTTFGGQYARYNKANYNLTTPDNWREYGRTAEGDTYLLGLGTNEGVTTATVFPANQAVFIAAVVGGAGTENAVILECGWGTPGAAFTVSLRFRANGDTEVYKGAVRVGVYNFRELNNESNGRQGQGAGVPLAGRTVSFMLIPKPRRELLVLSNQGGGFSHSFSDLDPKATNNVVTAAGTFFWRVPVGQPVVQMCPLKYAANGYAYSPVVNLRYALQSGQSFAPTYAQDLPTTGITNLYTALVKPDLTTYTPDGVQKQLRIQAQMTGDGNSTRFLYAIDLVCPRTTTTTFNAPFSVLPYLTKLTMEVPENAPTMVNLTCKKPAAMEAAGLAKARVIGERPILIRVGGIDIFRGTTGKPTTIEGAGHRDGATLIEWSATDRERQFDLYSFRDTFPYDGLLMTNTISELVKTAGFAATDADITADTFTLPYSLDVAEGKWQLLPQRGDTINQWLKRLWQDYAQTCITGWTPTLAGYKYRFRRPDTFSVLPVLDLFETTAGASRFGVSPQWVTRRVVRNLKRMPEAAPANEVLVVGYDAATDTYPQAQYDDAAAQNPELAPSARPDNWSGQVVSYQLIDPQLVNNQATADRARDILRDRATVGREIIEIECEFLVRASNNLPLWKGDVVRIYKDATGPGAGVLRGDYRILAISDIEFLLENRQVPLRPCTYRLLKLTTGSGNANQGQEYMGLQ